MKSYIQKNLPFLSILVIAALIISPLILASDFADFGDFNDFSDFGDFDDFADFGDFNDFSDFGDYQDFSDYGDYNDFTDSGNAEGPYHEPPYQPAADKDDKEQPASDDPFDPIFDPDPEFEIPPFEIPPFVEAYEAVIDLEISSSPNPVQPGNELTYTIKYYNRGNGDARDITITLDADTFAPIQSSKPSASAGNNEWKISQLKSKTGGTITVTTKVKANAENSQTLKSTAHMSYYDPVYGDKKTSATEYTQVKIIGDGQAGPKDETLKIRILSARLPAQSAIGETIMMTISIENKGTEKLTALKIAAVSQELALRTNIGPFDLAKGEETTKTLMLEIPEGTPEGTYYIRFTATSNSQAKHAVHKDIELVSTFE